MALKTKTIKIGEFDINIIQFNALEALKLRKDLFLQYIQLHHLKIH